MKIISFLLSNIVFTFLFTVLILCMSVVVHKKNGKLGKEALGFSIIVMFLISLFIF